MSPRPFLRIPSSPVAEGTPPPTLLVRSRLTYPDANATPWPLNHHAYVHACIDRLRKEVRHEPRVQFPESHLQIKDIRNARVRLEPTEETPGLRLSWDERRGWFRMEGAARHPLVLGAEPLLSPEVFTHAVTALLSPEIRQVVMVADRDRKNVHPVDPLFERRLAAYRRP